MSIENYFTTLYDLVNQAVTTIESMGKEDTILVLTHIDADGLTSASIIANLLNQIDKPFIIKPLNQIRKDILENIQEKNEPSELIILDMGSGDLELITKIFKDAKKTLIIDHHIPKTITPSKQYPNGNFTFLNPWLVGYNGTTDVSTSGLAYLVTYPYAQKINQLKKMVVNAIVGATGDNQDVGERSKFVGINKEIVDIGKKSGYIEEYVDIKIYRRESKPLYKALSESYNLDIPGITGNEESALKFLESIGIIQNDEDKMKTLADLTENEKIKMIDEILSRLVFAYSDKYTVDEIRNNIMGTILVFPHEKKGPTRNNKEFAGLLNACGKLGNPEIGLAIAIGDRGKIYEKGVEMFNNYQEIISELIGKAMENLEVKDRTILVNGEKWLDENLTSTISSMLSYSNKLETEGVIIVIGKSTNDYLKISLRLTPNLKGKINLRELLQKVTSEIPNSSGGGHDVAAGAYVPIEYIDTFLTKITNEIKKLV